MRKTGRVAAISVSVVVAVLLFLSVAMIAAYTSGSTVESLLVIIAGTFILVTGMTMWAFQRPTSVVIRSGIFIALAVALALASYELG